MSSELLRDLSPEEREDVERILRAAEGRAEQKALEAARQSATSLVRHKELAMPGATLSFEGLAYSAALPDGSKKPILESCSGHFEPGHVVAIMGPSGCGKTTMLDMLAMKKTSSYQGEVRVNGHLRDPHTFRRIAAYVPQEDRMPEHWRVREAIEFNARLKQQAGGSGHDVRELVDALLSEFGLAEVAGTYIGGAHVRGISGGQRRRVSLARGVAARAPILFCDEPTSGLSATDAELCVRALQAITRKFNVLTVAVIHQPRVEVVDLFDTLVLLTSSPGRLTYFGPMAEAPAYFEARGLRVPSHANPADFYMDAVTPGSSSDVSDNLVAAYRQVLAPGVDAAAKAASMAEGLTVSRMLQAMSHEPEGSARTLHPEPCVSERAAPWRTQLAVVLCRKARITARNPMAGALTMLIPCLMGTLLGSVFQGIASQMFLQQVPFFFILVTGSCFQSMGFMAMLIDERTVMKYETSEALYGEGVVALSNFLIDVPVALVGASAQILIAFSFSGYSSDLLQTIFCWTLLVFFVYDSLFACVAACAPDAQLAQLVATPMLTIFMLFNGFVITRGGAPPWFHWVFELSPNFHTMQSLVTNVASTEGPEAEVIVDTFGYEHGHETKAFLVMVGSIIVFRICQVVALKMLNNIQR